MEQTQRRISDERLAEPSREDWRKAHAMFSGDLSPTIQRAKVVELQAYFFMSRRELTALRASHKRLVNLCAEYIDALDSGYDALASAATDDIRAALVEARKLEGK